MYWLTSDQKNHRDDPVVKVELRRQESRDNEDVSASRREQEGASRKKTAIEPGFGSPENLKHGCLRRTGGNDNRYGQGAGGTGSARRACTGNVPYGTAAGLRYERKAGAVRTARERYERQDTGSARVRVAQYGQCRHGGRSTIGTHGDGAELCAGYGVSSAQDHRVVPGPGEGKKSAAP
ncbi:hypothetical protein B0H17DRAFT_1180350 [Mycena rosella]|uniref:Uncharacterized protein n=1 Tax=Mycena rosella TaxID=1033263 RepID=A0AAD7DE66_MYCRO|nr:hypothetical protein B0H17DRAFT_1180350 [Mycena rosella]